MPATLISDASFPVVADAAVVEVDSTASEEVDVLVDVDALVEADALVAVDVLVEVDVLLPHPANSVPAITIAKPSAPNFLVFIVTPFLFTFVAFVAFVAYYSLIITAFTVLSLSA